MRTMTADTQGGAAPITFYFDFISPYAYLAWCKLPELAARHGRRLDACPVLFASILATLGTRGPAEAPARRGYLVKDLLRRAHDLGVPFTLPPAHPFNPLLALRVAALAMTEAQRARVITLLYDATWRTGEGIDGAALVERALAPLGESVAAGLIARAGAPEAKQPVRAHTDALLAASGFGVPTMIVDGELFFGSDALPWLDAFLRGDDPAARGAALIERWRDLPATARRPGT